MLNAKNTANISILILLFVVKSAYSQDFNMSGLYVIDYDVLSKSIVNIKYVDTLRCIEYSSSVNNPTNYSSVVYYSDSVHIYKWENYQNGILMNCRDAVYNNESKPKYLVMINDTKLPNNKYFYNHDKLGRVIESKISYKSSFLSKRKIVSWHKFHYVFSTPIVMRFYNGSE